LSFGKYFAFGLLVPILGIIAAIVAKPDEERLEERELESGDRIRCPSCAELIHSEASLCQPGRGSSIVAMPMNARATVTAVAGLSFPFPSCDHLIWVVDAEDHTVRWVNSTLCTTRGPDRRQLGGVVLPAGAWSPPVWWCWPGRLRPAQFSISA
jgi:hypothetical protein